MLPSKSQPDLVGNKKNETHGVLRWLLQCCLTSKSKPDLVKNISLCLFAKIYLFVKIKRSIDLWIFSVFFF